MAKKLTFIEEAEIKGFAYRPGGILGNGFYGNGVFVTLTEMEKINKTGMPTPDQSTEDLNRIDGKVFIENEGNNRFLTADIFKLFPDLKKHHLHNFLNRYYELFQSQKLFTVENRKRIYSQEAIRLIYKRLIKKEEEPVKKRGRRSNKIEIN